MSVTGVVPRIQTNWPRLKGKDVVSQGPKKLRISSSPAARTVAAILAVLGIASPSSATQGLSFADRFNSVIETVQQGIDLFWPGDFESENINARLGVGFGWMPDYMGSNSYHFKAVPIIDIKYKEVWRLTGSKLAFTVFRQDGFEAGPFLNLHFGREEKDSVKLAGLGNIGNTFDVGMFVRYKRESLLIEADARKALGEGQGMMYRLMAGHGLYQSGNWAAAGAIRVRYLSKSAMQTNFGITDTQASNSLMNYDPFYARSGISDATANIIGAYRVTDKFRLMGLVSLGHLFSDAADSPLVKGSNGSPLQLMTGVGFTMMF